ncbi:MAG: lipopolysaccharide biosynthesis protein [Terriglobales bacterium]
MIARNVFSNWGGLAITGFVSFLLTPVLIHGLGEFHYGMWILVAALMDYRGLLDLGLSSALQRFVARRHGGDERRALNETLASALALMCGVALLAFVLTLGLSLVLPRFFGLDGATRDLFAKLFLLMGTSIAVSFPTRMLGAYLGGLQRFDLYNLGAVVISLLRAGALVSVIHMGYGVLGVGGVTLGVSLLNLVLNWVMIRRADPAAVLDFRLAKWRRVRELMQFGFYVFVTAVGDHFRFNLDSIVIARWITIAAVTPFSVAVSLVGYFRSLVMAVSGPLMPAFSSLDGASKDAAVKDLLLRSTRITSLLSLLIGGLLLVHGRSVFALWLGPRFVESSYPVLVALVAGSIVAMAQTPSLSLIYARGRHRTLAGWTLLEGLANLVLSVYWSTKLGILGVALGTAVPMIAFKLILQPWYALRVAGLGARAYLAGAVVRPLLVGIIFLSVCFSTTVAPLLQPLQLVWTLTWQTGFFFLLAMGLGFSRQERQQLGEALRNRGTGQKLTGLA